MSFFDARQIDGDAEGLDRLASILHPTKRGRSKALAHGRCRAAQAAKGIDVWIQRPSGSDRATGAGLFLPT